MDPAVFDRASGKWHLRFVHWLYEESPVPTRSDKTMLRLTPGAYFDDENGKASGWHKQKRVQIMNELRGANKVGKSMSSRIAYLDDMTVRAAAYVEELKVREQVWRLLASVCVNRAVFDGGNWFASFLNIFLQDAKEFVSTADGTAQLRLDVPTYRGSTVWSGFLGHVQVEIVNALVAEGSTVPTARKSITCGISH